MFLFIMQCAVFIMATNAIKREWDRAAAIDHAILTEELEADSGGKYGCCSCVAKAACYFWAFSTSLRESVEFTLFNAIFVGINDLPRDFDFGEEEEEEEEARNGERGSGGGGGDIYR